MAASNVMPSTIQTVAAEGQRTWAKTHDNTVREYGEGERARAGSA